MKPVLERHDNRVKLNLAIPFAVWAGLFGVLAWVFHSWFLVVVALLPILLFWGFLLLGWVTVLLGVVIFYLAGKPVEWTSGSGQVKTFQRKTR